MKHNLIVLMGAPGVGKGTFSQMMRDNMEYNYIEVGAMLRELPADSEIGRTIARGDLVPDTALFGLVGERITPDSDILMDGFPRTIGQAQWLVNNYAETFNIHVLFLNVPENVIMARLTKRQRDGSTRADDANPAIVRHRIDNFVKTTMPAIDWLRTAPHIRFDEVDVSGPVDENFVNIMETLNNR